MQPRSALRSLPKEFLYLTHERKLSPILNNPYEEPRLHYDADLNGNLDYNKILQGRRPYSAHIGVAPNRVESALFTNADVEDDDPNAPFINAIREEVKRVFHNDC